MTFLKALILYGCLITIVAHADDNVANGTAVYVSPDVSATNGMPGNPDRPYNDPVAANSITASGGSLIFLPGTYNLFKTIPLLNHENVFISQGANLINWVIATNGGTGPLFLITNNVKITIDGTISDAYAPGNPIEQCSIGLFEFTPKNGTSVATNILITGNGSIYGASECISFENTNACSGRIENLHLYAYHSPFNFGHGSHNFTIDGVAATLLPSSTWPSYFVNQVIYCFPDPGYTNTLVIKNSTLLALPPASHCLTDAGVTLPQDQFTLLNNYLTRADGSNDVIYLEQDTTGPGGPVIRAPFGTIAPININPVQYVSNRHGISYFPAYTLKFNPPNPVLPQVTNNYTFTSLATSNMIIYNKNGVPTVAWSLGGSNTFSAPLLIGRVTTNAPGRL